MLRVSLVFFYWTAHITKFFRANLLWRLRKISHWWLVAISKLLGSTLIIDIFSMSIRVVLQWGINKMAFYLEMLEFFTSRRACTICCRWYKPFCRWKIQAMVKKFQVCRGYISGLCVFVSMMYFLRFMCVYSVNSRFHNMN